jgi:hypothetical protein
MDVYGTLVRSGRAKKEKNGKDEANWGTMYTYMKMSQ